MGEEASEIPAAASASKENDEPNGEGTESNETNEKGSLEGMDIAKMLSGPGPIVTCVVLRAGESATNEDDKKAKATDDDDTKQNESPELIPNLIEEISLDTTPKKSQVHKVLGGPLTFLGQFPEEGLMAMVRQRQPPPSQTESIGLLRRRCADAGIDTEQMLEKRELLQALEQAAAMSLNPHVLPPPLHNLEDVRGDILLLKVAEIDDDEDPVPHEQFFLNYTKDQWMSYYKTIQDWNPPPQETEEAEEEESEEEDNNDEDEEFFVGEDDDEEVDPADRTTLMNLILGQVIQAFRAANQRGPNTEELLELRSQVARKLGIADAVATAQDVEGDGENETDACASPSSNKRVKFTHESEEEESATSKSAPDPAPVDPTPA